MTGPIPIVLFTYARPDHLTRTLDSLRANHVPLIYAFSDGPRTPDKAPAVSEVRQILRSIDWCEVALCERETNLGLGISIRTGVTEVFQKHDTLIVFEDDLICVPGTYQYLCAALEHYRDDPRVMSVTAYTHPRVIPSSVTDQPYFDGRAESWSWGSWARVWEGMDKSAVELMQACKARGIDVSRYGTDLVTMAEQEFQWNIWAVRFVYLHILNDGLCLRPPHSLVDHVGFDKMATNATVEYGWGQPPLQPAPAIPDQWPVSVENPECASLWHRVYEIPPLPTRIVRKIRRELKKLLYP